MRHPLASLVTAMSLLQLQRDLEWSARLGHCCPCLITAHSCHRRARVGRGLHAGTGLVGAGHGEGARRLSPTAQDNGFDSRVLSLSPVWGKLQRRSCRKSGPCPPVRCLDNRGLGQLGSSAGCRVKPDHPGAAGAVPGDAVSAHHPLEHQGSCLDTLDIDTSLLLNFGCKLE